MAKKTRNTADTIRAYSNRRSRKNKYSGSQEFPTRNWEKMGRNEKRSLCNGCGQREKLLQLQRFWSSGTELQKLENNGPRKKNRIPGQFEQWTKQFKWGRELNSSQLGSCNYNRFAMLSRVMNNILLQPRQ